MNDWTECVVSAILLFEIEKRGPVLVDELEHPAAAARDAGQRIFGNDDRQARFLHQQLVDVSQ